MAYSLDKRKGIKKWERNTFINSNGELARSVEKLSIKVLEWIYSKEKKSKTHALTTTNVVQFKRNTKLNVKGESNGKNECRRHSRNRITNRETN